MKESEIWMKRKDLITMLEILDNHPEFDRNFRVIYKSYGIGSILDLEFCYKNTIVRENIVNSDEW